MTSMSVRSHEQGCAVVLQQEYTPLELPGDLRSNAMLNHLKWIAAAVLALGIVPAGSGQAARQPEGNYPVAQSLIEMERQWSESATPTDEIRVVQKLFAEDFLGTDTDGKLYTKSEKIAEEKARTSTGEVLSPRLDDVKVRFFGDNLAVLCGRESSMA